MKRILLAMGLIALLALAACVPISPTEGTVPSMPGANGGGLPPGPADPTTIILPDGNTCLWAGEGATLAFDGERVNYTCSTENTVLIGDPVMDEDTIWTVTVGTLNGTELASSEEVTFQLNELDLVDDSVCLHAGRGATMAFEEGRLNWSCGEDTQGMYGAFGPLQHEEGDAPGAYYAIKILIGQNDSGFYPQTTFRVPVTTIIGGEVTLTPGEAAAAMPGSDGGGLPPLPPDPTTIELPDGNTCLWAGEGATLAFDGERVNYTCSTENTVLIGDPVATEDAVWTVTVGTLNGTELASSEEVTFQLNELDLVDGSTCLNAGRGATVGVDGERLNWTCGDPTDEGQYGVFGPLTVSADVPGAYIANKILFTMGDSGATAKTTFAVPVTKIVGGDVQQTPGEIAMATQAASNTYTSPAGFTITIPASWIANNYTVEELTGADATALHPLAQNVTRFVYTPVDSAYNPQAVLTIYTFTTEDWATIDTDLGPPVGSEVATGDGVVYVASTPQSNPYPEGTQDATNFNAMAADIGTAVASIQ